MGLTEPTERVTIVVITSLSASSRYVISSDDLAVSSSSEMSSPRVALLRYTSYSGMMVLGPVEDTINDLPWYKCCRNE